MYLHVIESFSSITSCIEWPWNFSWARSTHGRLKSPHTSTRGRWIKGRKTQYFYLLDVYFWVTGITMGCSGGSVNKSVVSEREWTQLGFFSRTDHEPAHRSHGVGWTGTRGFGTILSPKATSFIVDEGAASFLLLILTVHISKIEAMVSHSAAHLPQRQCATK